MRKAITAITVLTCTLFSGQAFAEDKGFIDVFEETAVSGADDIKTYPISVTGEMNKVIGGDFNCVGDNICAVEISVYPKNGKIEVNGNDMTFSYTPKKDFVGKDVFYYKVSNGRYTSNVSKCSIKVKQSLTDKGFDVFGFSDMEENKSEYAAAKLIEENVISIEKIGKNYYFYPDAYVKRRNAIGCISRISEITDKTAACFAGSSVDKSFFSKNTDDEVYCASKFGIIYGDKDNEENFSLDEVVTRAEFLCMLERTMNPKGESEYRLNFADLPQIPDYAVKSVKRLAAAKIIDNNDKLRPNEPLTKAEMAELLYRYMCYEQRTSEKSADEKIIEKLYPEIKI